MWYFKFPAKNNSESAVCQHPRVLCQCIFLCKTVRNESISNESLFRIKNWSRESCVKKLLIALLVNLPQKVPRQSAIAIPTAPPPLTIVPPSPAAAPPSKTTYRGSFYVELLEMLTCKPLLNYMDSPYNHFFFWF